MDLNESSQICAQSLFVRSKVLPARTWLLKWKRDSWSQLLFGRILKPSHGEHFVTAWTSLLVATPANHSAQQESDSAQKTQDIFGPTSQAEFGFFDPNSASLRMSKDTSVLDSEKSLENWNKWVTRCRGEYSLRVKSAHLTRENESLSWPTSNARDWKDSINGTHPPSRPNLSEQTLGQAVSVAHGKDVNWVTPSANDTNRTPEAYARAKEKHGSSLQASLQIQAQQHGLPAPANWPTPIQGDSHLASTPEAAQRRIAEGKVTLSRLVESGLPALANPSTLGSHQGWLTPQLQDSKHSGSNPSANGERDLLVNQVNWATPQQRDFKDAEPLAKWTIRAEEQKAKGVNLHLALPYQVMHTEHKQWATPQSRDAKGAEGRMIREGQHFDLPSQTEVQATGTWNRNNGKLNPRWVETLMGLPIGWTMPSCKSPVTIELTSCGSLETESCQQPQNEHSELF